MRKLVIAATAIALVGGAVVTTAVIADMRPAGIQLAHGWGPGGHGWRGHDWRGHRAEGPMRFARHLDEAHIEAFITFARTRLGIEEGQEEAFGAFADTVRASAADIRAVALEMMPEEDGERRRPSAIERLDRIEAMAEVGHEALQNVAPALRELYAVLDEDQRALVDSLGERRERRDRR
jgi:hypothetical protein